MPKCKNCGVELGAVRSDGGPSTVDIFRNETTWYKGIILENGDLEIWTDTNVIDGGEVLEVVCQNCNQSVNHEDEVWK